MPFEYAIQRAASGRYQVYSVETGQPLWEFAFKEEAIFKAQAANGWHITGQETDYFKQVRAAEEAQDQ